MINYHVEKIRYCNCPLSTARWVVFIFENIIKNPSYTWEHTLLTWSEYKEFSTSHKIGEDYFSWADKTYNISCEEKTNIVLPPEVKKYCDTFSNACSILKISFKYNVIIYQKIQEHINNQVERGFFSSTIIDSFSEEIRYRLVFELSAHNIKTSENCLYSYFNSVGSSYDFLYRDYDIVESIRSRIQFEKRNYLRIADDGFYDLERVWDSLIPKYYLKFEQLGKTNLKNDEEIIGLFLALNNQQKRNYSIYLSEDGDHSNHYSGLLFSFNKYAIAKEKPQQQLTDW